MIQENISLKKYNTFGIDAIARYFSSFKNVDELNELLEFNQSSNKSQPPSILVLGGGSNLLFTKNFDGLVLKNEIPGIEKISEDEDYVYIKVGAGVNWHSLVMHCINNDWAGL